MAPGVYPFEAQAGLLRLRPAVDYWVYLALLLMSVEDADFRRRRQFNVPNLVFDRLARDALLSLLGPKASSRRFAWPRSDGRPTKFDAAVAWLADLLDLPLGAGEKRPDRKDGGVDVVAWRPFVDRRAKYLIILAQCTIQRDFRWKAHDIEINQWIHWIQFGWPPDVLLAIPFAVPLGSPIWDDMHYTASVVLDRMRLCELLQDVDVSAADVELLKRWVQRQMNLYELN